MSSEFLYELRNVKHVVADDRVILDIGHLIIAEGALTAVTGPNGAGKSTLLKLLAFLEMPKEGEIYFRGKKVAPKSMFDLRRSVTMVNQSPLLFQGTVFKNVAYGLKVRGVPREDWPERVEEALSMVDMSGFESRSVRGLSGGEVQRVAIARSLVFRPEVILLDEPTAAVDAVRVEMVEAIIRDVNKRLGAGVIFSTHNIAQAHRLTDRVINMSAGKLIEEGVENVFSGYVETSNGHTIIRTRGGAEVEIPGPHAGLVRFSIPSSCIELKPTSNGSDKFNRFEGIVTRMEMRGKSVRIRLEGDLNLRVEVPPDKLKEREIMLGRRFTATFRPEDVSIIE